MYFRHPAGESKDSTFNSKLNENLKRYTLTPISPFHLTSTAHILNNHLILTLPFVIINFVLAFQGQCSMFFLQQYCHLVVGYLTTTADIRKACRVTK